MKAVCSVPSGADVSYRFCTWGPLHQKVEVGRFTFRCRDAVILVDDCDSSSWGIQAASLVFFLPKYPECLTWANFKREESKYFQTKRHVYKTLQIEDTKSKRQMPETEIMNIKRYFLFIDSSENFPTFYRWLRLWRASTTPMEKRPICWYNLSRARPFNNQIAVFLCNVCL